MQDGHPSMNSDFVPLASLTKKGWLCRRLQFPLPDGLHTVEYDGKGLGYERVIVDGETIHQRSLFWFVPRFDFTIGRWDGEIEVRVWPWLTLRSLVIRIEGHVIYAEGIELSEERP